VLGAGFTPADRAAQIVAEANARAVEIEDEARNAGFAGGHAAGLAQAEQELEAPRAAFLQAIEGVEAVRDEASAAAEPRAVELALAIAERIVAAALEIDPGLVCNVVGGALRRVVDRDRLVIDVNPDDVVLVRDWISSQSEVPVAGVEVRGERRVARGGCVVRTNEGEIDGRVAEQLVRAEEVLRDTLAESRA
jgi:flagellar assembly protein FliH